MPTEVKIVGVPAAIWLALVSAACVAVFVRRMVFLVRVLARGRPENRLNDLPLRVRTFLREVIGQERLLAGESIINWAHPLIFWGFCLFVVASALLFLGGILAPWVAIPQVEAIPVLGTLVDLFAVLVLVGLAGSSIRRYILRPPGLQRTLDATIVVLLIAALMATYLLAEAGGVVKERLAGAEGLPEGGLLRTQTWLPAGAATAVLLEWAGMSAETIVAVGTGAWWAHAGILLFFLVYLPYSKHMHLIWAPLAVFAAELPHKGTLPEAPAPGQEPSTPLGQFTWRQLLSAYACAECGRCERACPAFLTGSKLSPRELVSKMKSFVLEEGRAAVTGKARSGAKRFIGETISPEVLWACTTCYACMDQCPVRNEHVPIIVQMRRELVSDGQLDASLQEALTSLQRYGNSLGKSAHKRFEWARGLPSALQDASKQPVDALWFLGDYAAYHPSCSAVSAKMAQVFQAAGLDFGVVGKGEKSSGNDVRRAGEEGLFEMLAEQNMKLLAGAQFQRIVTTDPHTYHTLKNEYPKFGLDKPVVHYTELLDELMRQGRLGVRKPLGWRATYHDPCYLGRYNGVYDPPRRLLAALGVTLVEMPRHRADSFCCGAGGGRIWMKDVPGIRERPAENRIREALALPGVEYFVVACPKDLAMFQDAVKTVRAEDRLKVVDLGELVWQSVIGDNSCEAKP